MLIENEGLHAYGCLRYTIFLLDIAFLLNDSQNYCTRNKITGVCVDDKNEMDIGGKKEYLIHVIVNNLVVGSFSLTRNEQRHV